jgi:hypothetical protein
VPKSAITIALAAMMVTTAPAAFAQPMKATSAAFTTQSGKLRAGQIIGSTVYDVQNRDIGSVKDIVLDNDGKVSDVVVNVGSFLGAGGKYVAVSLNDFKTDNDRLTLDRSKEQLQSAPSYQLDNKRR